ncbi:hypothetical protein ACGFZB_28690 [Streptomyces cinerochromogenes]|uniref:Uncharacterized protein n=1 Tax=Streptomyces cinerochromogenes TaxID=66422 RepID=A0ABW7BAV3_9ACTN
MALSVETAERLAELEERTPSYSGRCADGTIFVAREVTEFLVALTTDIARLERRVKELEESQ